MKTLETIQQHATNIKSGRDPKVKPGQATRFTEASTIGDTIAQGDLYLQIVSNAVPSDYELVAKSTERDKQLVPGQTQGARHCLDSLDGVRIYRPTNWTGEDLRGPLLVLAKERTILHPTHGSVTIPAGFAVLCAYQPEWDAELRKQRRNVD